MITKKIVILLTSVIIDSKFSLDLFEIYFYLLRYKWWNDSYFQIIAAWSCVSCVIFIFWPLNIYFWMNLKAISSRVVHLYLKDKKTSIFVHKISIWFVFPDVLKLCYDQPFWLWREHFIHSMYLTGWGHFDILFASRTTMYTQRHK